MSIHTIMKNLSIQDYTFSSEIEKRKHVEVLLLLFVLSIMGLIISIWAMISNTWGGVDIIPITLGILSVIGIALSGFNIYIAAGKKIDADTTELCYKSPKQRQKHLSLYTLLFIVSIIGAVLGFIYSGDMFSIVETPLEMLLLIISIVGAIITLRGMVQTAAVIKDCEN